MMDDDNSLMQLAPVANIQINRAKKRVSLVLSDVQSSSRNKDLKVAESKGI
jgi:hypothetical protein